ncbi:MAG: NAD-dependent epimerase/dehydratase family protein [Thaumarchaeota archaeon]|nr:NAD-dependent epimerase/dehydratase family protein [Nitrososphaerota archaeon]
MDLKDNFQRRKFLVTGGAGFVGSHISEALLNLGANVVVLDDLSGGTTSNLPRSGKLKFVKADIRSFDLEKLGKLDGIFHEACRTIVPSFQEPISDLEVNAGGTVRVLEFARRSKIKVIHASSASVYGDPVSSPIKENHPLKPLAPYGVSKLAAENYCVMYQTVYGVDVPILRYFNVFGERQEIGEEKAVIPFFTSQALKGKPILVHGDGLQSREFLHVSDAVKANLRAYTTEKISGIPINIGSSGNEITILDLAKKIIKLTGSKSEIRHMPPKLGDIKGRSADTTRAEKLLGHISTVTLNEGLKEYVDHAMKTVSHEYSTKGRLRMEVN